MFHVPATTDRDQTVLGAYQTRLVYAGTCNTPVLCFDYLPYAMQVFSDVRLPTVLSDSRVSEVDILRHVF